MSKVAGKILSVNKGKSGEKNGRKWQIYEVVIGQEMYKTFDDQFLRLIGKEGEFEYTEDSYGKTLSRLPRQFQGSKMDDKLDLVLKRLDEVLEMVSLLLPIKKDNTPNEDSQIPF